jgi:uncharacterized protein (TIGR02145 family)
MKKLSVFIITLLSISITQAQVNIESVIIGEQTWMVKNLDVATYRNGDPIPNITNEAEWKKLTSGAYCYYKNDSATYAAIYGKLYNWFAVNDPRGLAPKGWHVPSDAEWTTIENYLGGKEVAGGKMKEIGTIHWTTPNTDATNISGFTGLSGGSRTKDGTFDLVPNYSGFWWSTTNTNLGIAKANPNYYAKYRRLNYNDGILSSNTINTTYGFYVRCLMD